jgi:hypothetical protein
MDIQAEKLQLIEQLLRTRDIRILEQVKELLAKENNPIVGYEANGLPITQKDFVRMIEESEEDYRKGKFQSMDDVEKESEGW